jgi:hypothetical protein
MRLHGGDAARNTDHNQKNNDTKNTTTRRMTNKNKTNTTTTKNNDIKTTTTTTKINDHKDKARNNKQSPNRAGILMPPAVGPREIRPSRDGSSVASVSDDMRAGEVFHAA